MIKKTFTSIYYGAVGYMLSAQLLLAQVIPVGGITNPLKSGTNSVPQLLVLIINNFVLPIGGVIVTFMFIYTGFQFVMAQGNEGKLEEALALEERRRKLNIQPTMVEPWVEV